MGLDQRIIEVRTTRNRKKIMKSDLWNKYTKQKNKIALGGVVNMYMSGINSNMSPIKEDIEKMKKDGLFVFKTYRKNNQLQGWFEKKYRIQNTGNIRLTEQNLNKLINDIKSDNLPLSEGFFYGDSKMSKEDEIDLINDLEIVKDKIVSKGKLYLYTSWY